MIFGFWKRSKFFSFYRFFIQLKKYSACLSYLSWLTRQRWMIRAKLDSSSTAKILSFWIVTTCPQNKSCFRPTIFSRARLALFFSFSFCSTFNMPCSLIILIVALKQLGFFSIRLINWALVISIMDHLIWLPRHH